MSHFLMSKRFDGQQNTMISQFILSYERLLAINHYYLNKHAHL